MRGAAVGGGPHLERGEGRLQVLFLSRGQHNVGALLRQAARNAKADAEGGQGERKVGKAGEEEKFVRLTTIDLTGKEKVCTLQPDPLYWPAMDLRRDAATGVWTLQEEKRQKKTTTEPEAKGNDSANST